MAEYCGPLASPFTGPLSKDLHSTTDTRGRGKGIALMRVGQTDTKTDTKTHHSKKENH